MEKFERNVARIAPGPERSDKEPLLDAIVVIPAMDEGLNIIDTIESIVLQRKPADREFIQGAVVVINNRPNASEEVIASNMRTYTLLQGIRYGCRMTVQGDPALTEKIKKIQESGIQIEVLDAFSEENAHPESNVGRARKLGTDYAATRLKDERSAIVSTDADTVLGPDALLTAQHIFENEKVDATPMELGRKVDDLDARSQKAYMTYALYWNLNNVAQSVPDKVNALRTKGMPFPISDPSKIASSAVWLSGGGTAFTRIAYEKSGGYRPIGREEDTLLASDMVNAELRIKDMTKKYPQLIAYTRPRISLRTERGFGHTIAHWDKPDAAFESLAVEDPATMRSNLEFYRDINALVGKAGKRSVEQKFKQICTLHGIQPEKIDLLWNSFSRWDGRASREEHFRFMEETRRVFESSSTKISMSKLLETAEHENAEYSQAVQEATWAGHKLHPSEEEWDWNAYRKAMTDMVVRAGVDMSTSDGAAKIRAVIASGYVPHYETVVRNWMFVFVNELRKNMQSRSELTPDEKKLSKAKGLSKFTLKEYHRLNLCQMEAAKISVFRGIQRNLQDVLPTEVKKNIETMLSGFRQEYDEVSNAIISDPREKDEA